MPAPPRSIWKGAIQFGLVVIPCKGYLGSDPPATGAHLLHAPCHGRVQQRLWCPTCEVDATRSETERGFEVAPDRWVVVSDAELETLPVRTLHAVDVLQFVPLAEAARLETWPRQTYYVAPEPLGRQAYALLRATLEDAGLVALSKIAIRDREHLATLRPLEDGLVLTTLAWPDEVRPISSLDLPPRTAVPEAELALARQLVLAMARPFDPAAHRDEYAAALRALVESKAAGAAFSAPAAEPSAALADLVAALQASVAAAAASRPQPVPARRATARATRKEAAVTAA